MLTFCAVPFYKVLAALHQTRGMVDNWDEERKKQLFDVAGREGWAKEVRELQGSLTTLDATLTLTAVDELLAHLEPFRKVVESGESDVIPY